MLKFNPNFKFTFKKNKDLDLAEATGYIQEYDIVRINVINKDGNVLDYPVKTQEDYLERIAKINQNDYILHAEVYASKHYFDINDYD